MAAEVTEVNGPRAPISVWVVTDPACLCPGCGLLPCTCRPVSTPVCGGSGWCACEIFTDLAAAEDYAASLTAISGGAS